MPAECSWRSHYDQCDLLGTCSASKQADQDTKWYCAAHWALLQGQVDEAKAGEWVRNIRAARGSPGWAEYLLAKTLREALARSDPMMVLARAVAQGELEPEAAKAAKKMLLDDARTALDGKLRRESARGGGDVLGESGRSTGA